MRNTTAKTLFEAAIESAARTENKWHTERDTHALMYSLEEITGIPYYFVNLAVKEAITQRLLRDLFDTCSRDLMQNLSARAHFVQGEKPTQNQRHAIKQPIFDIVDKYIYRLTYHADIPADFLDRQGDWYDFLEANMSSIDGAYSPECCEMIRQYITSAKADRAAKGGVA
jgi:hypothetical protein